jgi:amino acid transporter
MTGSQAFVNHVGIRLTARLTDFSGYLIFAVALLLTVALLAFASTWDWARLITFTNFGGIAGPESVWPAAPMYHLFLVGLLLPAYTITGFDASAHASEETVGADRRVPRGIVGAVLVSGIAGWIMLCSFVLAMPDTEEAARQGNKVFYWMIGDVLQRWARTSLCAGILIAQYLCGLATVTSASRMAFAFARDGGLPFSAYVRHVHADHRTPVCAIWTVAIAAVAFTLYAPVYETITAVCTILLYISYVIPILLGFIAYGWRWRRMGVWDLGKVFRPLALVSVLGCIGLIGIGITASHEAIYVIGTVVLVLGMCWIAVADKRFAGPPQGVLDQHRMDEIHAAEAAVQQAPIDPDGEPPA